MTEVLEKPEDARRPNAGVVLVDEDGTLRRHAAQGEQMSDHPHERAQRRLARIDQADAPEIEVHGALEMTSRKLLSRPCIDDKRIVREREGVGGGFHRISLEGARGFFHRILAPGC